MKQIIWLIATRLINIAQNYVKYSTIYYLITKIFILVFHHAVIFFFFLNLISLLLCNLSFVFSLICSSFSYFFFFLFIILRNMDKHITIIIMKINNKLNFNVTASLYNYVLDGSFLFYSLFGDTWRLPFPPVMAARVTRFCILIGDTPAFAATCIIQHKRNN